MVVHSVPVQKGEVAIYIFVERVGHQGEVWHTCLLTMLQHIAFAGEDLLTHWAVDCNRYVHVMSELVVLEGAH